MITNRMKKGFTLAELLIVVSIIAILVAVSIPIFTGRLEAAKEATCLANRRSLKAVMANDYLNEEYDTMTAAFTAVYQEDQAKGEKAEFICPKEGTYSWVGTDNSGTIKCSVHDGNGGGSGEDDGESGGDETGNYFPGTDDLEVVDSYWPYETGKKVNPGGIFMAKDGNYYVVVRSETTWDDKGPDGYYDAAVKLTGKIVTFNEIKNTTVARGIICKNGDDYYVAISGDWVSTPPTGPNSTWYKIPKTKG